MIENMKKRRRKKNRMMRNFDNKINHKPKKSVFFLFLKK